MEKYIPSREEAYELLKEYIKSDSLRKHALSVEGVMAHFAKLLNETDIEKWAIVGLVHDIDYEKYPQEHCVKAGEILRGRNWPEDYIHTVQSHGYKICSEVEPIERMEKVLYTIDEITGLIYATALMRPSKSILDLELKSVLKKWKDKKFAAGVDRTLIEGGAKLLAMDLNNIIEETIKGMQGVAEEIGLKGEL